MDRQQVHKLYSKLIDDKQITHVGVERATGVDADKLRQFKKNESLGMDKLVKVVEHLESRGFTLRQKRDGRYFIDYRDAAGVRQRPYIQIDGKPVRDEDEARAYYDHWLAAQSSPAITQSRADSRWCPWIGVFIGRKRPPHASGQVAVAESAGCLVLGWREVDGDAAASPWQHGGPVRGAGHGRGLGVSTEKARRSAST